MKRILSILLLAGACFTAQAQPQYTFGLTRPMPQEQVPKSRAPFGKAVPVPKKEIPVTLEKISPTGYVIQSGWELREAYKVTESQISPLKEGIPTGDWYNAVVPGTVLTTLVKSGVYPDPYWGLNNLAIPDTLCRMEWWYRVEFDAPRDEARERVRLVFEGINYRAEVWFNGMLLGSINGAFTRGAFDVTQAIHRTGKNVLAVRIIPPPNPGIPHEQNPHTQGNNGGLLCLDGPTFISSEGWDWVPGIRDRNIGIWQDVRLEYTGDVRLGDSQVITDLPLPDTTSVELTLKTLLYNASAKSCTAELALDVAGVTVRKQVELGPNATRQVALTPAEFTALTLKNPRLWWPNGYGWQELYTATVTASVEGRVSDTRQVRFGVREFDYEIEVVTKGGEPLYVDFNPTAAYHSGKPVLDIIKRKQVDEKENVYGPRLIPDLPHPGITPIGEQPTSPFLVLKVNGVKIFCKGGNWGMDDAMKNVSREHLEPYLKLHKEQHFNMIRNWTGESTEAALYDLCDEYGILVFNDFWLSTEGYNLNAVDERLFMANVNEVLVRYRNHPSIAIWCPRNEGFAPNSLEQDISASIAALDGTRHYIGSSIRLNTTVSGPWTPEWPVTYYKPEINRGFNSEIGAPCVPTAESMRRMMDEKDLWPIGDVWAYHTWLVGGWLNFRAWETMVAQTYGDFTGIDDFCRKSQLFGYDAYRAIFEAANSRMWDNTSGVLLWMSHPAWPSMAYQTYTWDYETTGPYYGCKDACKPLHVQMKLNDRLVQIVNNTETPFAGATVQAVFYDLDGRAVARRSGKFSVHANSVAACYTLENGAGLPDVYLLRLELRDARGRLLDRNDYWLNGPGGKEMKALTALPGAALKIARIAKMSDGRYAVTVENTGKTPALGLKLNLRDGATQAAILPAYFSEGYFNLLPRERRTVVLEAPSIPSQAAVSLEGYNAEPIQARI